MERKNAILNLSRVCPTEIGMLSLVHVQKIFSKIFSKSRFACHGRLLLVACRNFPVKTKEIGVQKTIPRPLRILFEENFDIEFSDWQTAYYGTNY